LPSGATCDKAPGWRGAIPGQESIFQEGASGWRRLCPVLIALCFDCGSGSRTTSTFPGGFLTCGRTSRNSFSDETHPSTVHIDRIVRVIPYFPCLRASVLPAKGYGRLPHLGNITALEVCQREYSFSRTSFNRWLTAARAPLRISEVSRLISG